MAQSRSPRPTRIGARTTPRWSDSRRSRTLADPHEQLVERPGPPRPSRRRPSIPARWACRTRRPIAVDRPERFVDLGQRQRSSSPFSTAHHPDQMRTADERGNRAGGDLRRAPAARGRARRTRRAGPRRAETHRASAADRRRRAGLATVRHDEADEPDRSGRAPRSPPPGSSRRHIPRTARAAPARRASPPRPRRPRAGSTAGAWRMTISTLVSHDHGDVDEQRRPFDRIEPANQPARDRERLRHAGQAVDQQNQAAHTLLMAMPASSRPDDES